MIIKLIKIILKSWIRRLNELKKLFKKIKIRNENNLFNLIFKK